MANDGAPRLQRKPIGCAAPAGPSDVAPAPQTQAEQSEQAERDAEGARETHEGHRTRGRRQRVGDRLRRYGVDHLVHVFLDFLYDDQFVIRRRVPGDVRRQFVAAIEIARANLASLDIEAIVGRHGVGMVLTAGKRTVRRLPDACCTVPL